MLAYIQEWYVNDELSYELYATDPTLLILAAVKLSHAE